MSATTPRWMRCLAREGAQLRACPDAPGRLAVYPSGDRRRRPLARLDDRQCRDALASGILTEAGEEGWILTPEGHNRLLRDQAGEQGHAGQHREMVARTLLAEDGALRQVRVNALASPLGRWAAGLSPPQLAAGERFCSDYACSTLQQAVTRNWSATPGCHRQGWRGAPEDAPLAAIAAKDRVMAALDAVGTGLDQLLVAVCVREESLAAVERRFGWARRSASTILKLALQQLARHYGLER